MDVANQAIRQHIAADAGDRGPTLPKDAPWAGNPRTDVRAAIVSVFFLEDRRRDGSTSLLGKKRPSAKEKRGHLYPRFQVPFGGETRRSGKAYLQLLGSHLACMAPPMPAAAEIVKPVGTALVPQTHEMSPLSLAAAEIVREPPDTLMLDLFVP